MSVSAGVLLVKEDSSQSDMVSSILLESGYHVTATIGMADDILGAVNQYTPDIVVVKTETASIHFMNQLYNLNQEQPKPIVIFTDNSESGLIDGAIKAGVSAYVVDGLSSARVKPVLEIAQARFEQEQSLRNELAKTKSQLEERKTIERAKGIIMKSRKLSEDEAYQALRKLAMNRNQKLIDVATDVISVSELLI